MTEDRATRCKRLTMRSWRRGMREVDLILGPFAQSRLGDMQDADIDIYEDLLGENDQEIYAWVSGTEPTPGKYADLIADVLTSINGK